VQDNIFPAAIFLTEAETFLLFSQDFPAHNLGFVDAKIDTIELEIAGRDFQFRQSPGLLTSNREEGTTGAVLWKITPLVAAWLATLPPILGDLGILYKDATILELGCGVTGLIGLTLARTVSSYIFSDQAYIMRYLRENLLANAQKTSDRPTKHSKANQHAGKSKFDLEKLKTVTLDWERDSAENVRQVLRPSERIDTVIVCDCVYNDYLIRPLVQTCADICGLGSKDGGCTKLLVAQQLRSDSIFESFMQALMEKFHVWRMPDDHLSTELRTGSGYAVHVAMLRHGPLDS